MLSDVSAKYKGVSVRTEGLARTSRALEQAGADSQDMKQLMHEIGLLVIRAARPPVLTGRLEASMKAGRGKTKAVVRAGGARVPYAPVIHYGNTNRNIEPRPYLLEALQQERGDVMQQLEKGMEDILRKNNLL
jgi:phage gpG-like protein